MIDYRLIGDVARCRAFFANWRDVTLQHIPVSTRTGNCLQNDVHGTDYKTLGMVADERDHMLLRIPNFGRHSLNEIRAIIAAFKEFWPLEAGQSVLPDDAAALRLEIEAMRARLAAAEKEAAKWRSICSTFANLLAV